MAEETTGGTIPDATPVKKDDPALALSATVKLYFPIKLGNEEKTELIMRRPKVRDRLAVDRVPNITDSDRMVQLIAILCGVAPDEMSQMDNVDLLQLQEQLAVFQNPQPKT